MTIYIKIEKDSDKVLVTFASDAVLNSVEMTKEELINYLTGANVHSVD